MDQEMEESDEDPEAKGEGRSDPRSRLSIFDKMQAIKEMDKLIEEGKKSGIEKAVMHKFPRFFTGLKGNKSGMLGRWKTQCDKQKWREIPFEKLSEEDRHMKELPDWVRIPLGLPPRSMERFKEGKQVPESVVNKVIEVVDRLSTGGESAQLTAGAMKVKVIQAEAQKFLDIYNKAQEEAAKDSGKKVPPVKVTVTERWVNRLLSNYGWRRRTPNTYGAYLAYDDERMEKSRKMFHFRRLCVQTCPNCRVF